MTQTAFYITLTSAFKDFLCSFAERTTDASEPFFKPATKKRNLYTTDAFTKIDKALEAFVSYQQAADRSFLAAEEARERREEEREEKRRKEDQDFLLKLVQVIRKQKERVFNNYICARTCDSFSWFSFRLYLCCKLKDVLRSLMADSQSLEKVQEKRKLY